MTYMLYTDGSAQPNPGHGGWAYLIEHEGTRLEMSGEVPGETTNNRAEFFALIKGLVAVPEGEEVTVVTDSEQVRLAIKGMRHPKKNKDLLAAIYALVAARHVTVERIAGHNGNANNERVDALAHAEAKGGNVEVNKTRGTDREKGTKCSLTEMSS